MAIYIVIWLLLLFLSYWRNNNAILWASILVLSIIAGLRADTVGTDTFTYREIFDGISSGIRLGIEPGWFLLNKAISWVGGGYQFLLWVVSILTLFPVSLVIIKESPNKQFSLFAYYSLYFYLNSFNGMRQFMAISIILLAYTILIKGKYWRFILLVLLASMFHFSALIALVALFIRKIKITSTRLTIALALSFIMGMIITNDLLTLFAGKYAVYLADTNPNATRESMASVIVMTLLLNGLVFWLYYSGSQIVRNNIWFKFFIAGIILHNLTIQFTLGARLILYFTVAQIILYPLYISDNRVKQKYLAFSIITLYLTVLFYKMLLANASEVVPYIMG